MSLLCIGCARAGGRRENCRFCIEVAPLPLSLKVQEVIRKAAIEHRAQQEADAAIFKADMEKSRDAHQKLLDRRAKYRRKQKEAANGPATENA